MGLERGKENLQYVKSQILLWFLKKASLCVSLFNVKIGSYNVIDMTALHFDVSKVQALIILSICRSTLYLSIASVFFQVD